MAVPIGGVHGLAGTMDAVETPTADPDTIAVDPSTIRDPLPQPFFSLRRLAIVALLAVAVGCLYMASRSAASTDESAGIDAIVSYLPTPGGRVLRQSEIGVELLPGYDGRLIINGVAIPEDQMVGAIDPSSAEYRNLPESQRQLGPRPNNRNIVKFQPGPGKVINSYSTGTVEVTVRFWRIADGPDSAESTTYNIQTF